MAVKYPRNINVRVTAEDIKALEKISKESDLPVSIILRKVLRSWIKSMEANSNDSTRQ